MFWNKIASLYDLFEIIYNKKVYTGTGKKVAEYINSEDEVLECACGTGAISIYIAEKCTSRRCRQKLGPNNRFRRLSCIHTNKGKKLLSFALSMG